MRAHEQCRVIITFITGNTYLFENLKTILERISTHRWFLVALAIGWVKRFLFFYLVLFFVVSILFISVLNLNDGCTIHSRVVFCWVMWIILRLSKCYWCESFHDKFSNFWVEEDKLIQMMWIWKLLNFEKKIDMNYWWKLLNFWSKFRVKLM